MLRATIYSYTKRDLHVKRKRKRKRKRIMLNSEDTKRKGNKKWLSTFSRKSTLSMRTERGYSEY